MHKLVDFPGTVCSPPLKSRAPLGWMQMWSSAAWHRSNIRLNKPFRKLCLPHIRFQSSRKRQSHHFPCCFASDVMFHKFHEFMDRGREPSRVAAQGRTECPPFHSLLDHLTPSRIGSYSKFQIVTPFRPPRSLLDGFEPQSTRLSRGPTRRRTENTTKTMRAAKKNHKCIISREKLMKL